MQNIIPAKNTGEMGASSEGMIFESFAICVEFC